MSFGYGIGDVLAVAGAIERIVGEVKSYCEAPQHFRRLAIELDFLGQVCNQVFTLQPTLPDERAHIERLRAIAMQCLGALRAFEDKMKKYDNTFGLRTDGNASHAPFLLRRHGLKDVRDFKTRLHWSAIARHEVDELRSILTSEIVAINTLLTIHEWSSLKTQGLVGQGHTEALRKLLDTAKRAATETQRFILGARIASQHLEQAIKATNLTQSEQLQILKIIEGKSSETYSSIQTLAEQQAGHTAGVRDALNTQMTRFCSFKRYMEEWIEKIVEQCKQLIAMVQKNTETLLSMHAMLASIVFENVLGIKMLLPYQLCDTWDTTWSDVLR
ncbi:hypothetical protein M406DRAFT_330034 [Cryphonectria parasitica EP155]|uniref:Fungal N-terminal domain-containing protein n=1 Tax=Cryphonectria parasitica (strain ATCC 38755 / EP155) TaxID=660469 RepID=A0A9P4Y3U8_CRYP1|nr:uncharacterized protein M406DRAFT_330034 [Cryphonectria parasitica EP155]KAF3766198.1 hypothetical protein M406DRAFT_330034 [Cryphonectria parasitica EP155]